MSDNIKPISWVSIWGGFEFEGDTITFQGYTYAPEVPKNPPQGGNTEALLPRAGVGRAISNQRLTDGTVSVEIEFAQIDPLTTAEIVLESDPTGDMLTVGLGANGVLLNVRHWTRSGTDSSMQQQTGLADENTPKWTTLRSEGDRRMLKSGQPYILEVKVQGAYVTVLFDGVEIGSGNLPFQLSGKQVGLFCQSSSNIYFRHLAVKSVKPLVFVVMQFDPPEYEELFNDVIVPVCDKMGLEPFRASQAFYPGLVIADIQRQIRESRVVIAEITPVNPNVYYEVGYADAIGKPVILIADGGKLEQLPFDVRAFRTLFYENSIGGKKKVEKALTDFLENIMNQKAS